MTSKAQLIEDKVLEAVGAYESGDYPTIKAAAGAFSPQFSVSRGDFRAFYHRLQKVATSKISGGILHRKKRDRARGCRFKRETWVESVECMKGYGRWDAVRDEGQKALSP